MNAYISFCTGYTEDEKEIERETVREGYHFPLVNINKRMGRTEHTPLGEWQLIPSLSCDEARHALWGASLPPHPTAEEVRNSLQPLLIWHKYAGHGHHGCDFNKLLRTNVFYFVVSLFL